MTGSTRTSTGTTRRQRMFSRLKSSLHKRTSPNSPQKVNAGHGLHSDTTSSLRDLKQWTRPTSLSWTLSLSAPFLSPLQPYEFLIENPRYLLRLCQHGDLRHIETVCGMIQQIGDDTSTIHHHNDKHRRRNTSRKDSSRLLQACRNQLLQRTQSEGPMAFCSCPPHSTVLHLVCGRPTVTAAAVHALLQAAAAVAVHTLLEPNENDDHDNEERLGQLSALVNANGETPLMVACRNHGASHSVIRVLLRNSVSCQTILECDQEGNSAMMSLASRYEGNDPKLKQLLLLCPSTDSVHYNGTLHEEDEGNDEYSATTAISFLQGKNPGRAWTEDHISVYSPMYLILEMIRVAWDQCTSCQDQEHNSSIQASSKENHKNTKKCRRNDARRSSLSSFPLWTAVAKFSDVLPVSVMDYLFRVAQPKC